MKRLWRPIGGYRDWRLWVLGLLAAWWLLVGFYDRPLWQPWVAPPNERGPFVWPL